MIRLGGIVLAIGLLPTLSEAQVPTAAGRTHTVQSRETLSGIASVYYGTASQWSRIFEANRDQLNDPDELQVGVVLIIPGEPSTEAQPASVTDVQVSGPQATLQAPLTFEARRALLESRPFEPASVPEVSPGERSVFFDVPQPLSQAPIVVLEGAAEVPAVPPSFFHAAGWLVPAGDPVASLGEIVGVADGRNPGTESTTGQLYEDVYIHILGGEGIGVGEEFLVYSFTRTIEGIGDVAAPSGRATVTETRDDGEVVAQIVQEFGRVQIGHLVTPLRTFPLRAGEHPIEVDAGLDARIVAMQEEKELYLPGDFAFIDGGQNRGFAIGDELVGFADAELGARSGVALARFQVVGLQDESATVRLASATSPRAVRPGLRLIVVKKMP